MNDEIQTEIKTESLDSVKLTKNAKGNWERWEFTIDGKKYSCFDANIYGKFQPPQIVKMTGEEVDKNGKLYFNMKTME